uniref:RxLR effector protein n=2 Tax=Phytophthora ramorum TaxID=164328 RepID=H3GWP1_PHYRM
MRLIFWALIVTLISLLSSGEAASTDKKQMAQRDSEIVFLPRELADNKDGERFLRTQNEKTADGDDDELDADDEERGVMMKIRGFLSNLGAKYHNWKVKLLTPRFEKLVKEGNSLDDVKKMYGIGEGGTPSRNKRFYKLFEEWAKTNYPNGLPKQ